MIRYESHPHAPNTDNRIPETEHDVHDSHEPRSERRGLHEEDEELDAFCPTSNPTLWYRKRAKTAV
jgi:hypothetical protein